jgi:pseudaminic acid cytidylyltransferase
MKIAVIPARGGSKRIPRKNIRSFCGKPMIARAVETALASGLFDHVVVSTDDDEIAAAALQAGAQVPFVRAPELSDDQTPTVPVIADAVARCGQLGWDVTHACCIYPCVPLLNAQDMAGALRICVEQDADFVYPVTEYAHPIQRAMRRLASGQMQFVQPEHELSRTQDLEKTFHDAGMFYWGKSSAWLAHKRMHSAGLGYPIPHWRVVDIDTEDDWRRAELIFRALESGS